MTATVSTTAKSSAATLSGTAKGETLDEFDDFLLKEDGDFLLLETGDKIVLEPDDVGLSNKSSNASLTGITKS